MFKLFSGLLDSNEKELKRLHPLVEEINTLEPEYEQLSDAELRAKTDEFKTRLADGESLDEILPEAFAAVREAAKRTIRQRHFDVQLMGGIVLHQGKIAEMKTGEGKTLVATLPLYLNALAGQGCHLVTVNDYLARRDCHWMGPIYHALGLSVASINAQQTADQHAPSYIYDPDYDSGDPQWRFLRPATRRQAYEADITYGTNNEFGFDYLRDNMVIDLSQCVQRTLNYAIVDEVDNILIDEARTPLIISGAAEEATQKYYTFAQLVSRLSKDEDYTIDERTRTASLTDMGITRIEKMLKKEGLLKAPDLYDPSNYFLTQYLESALKAHALFRRDRDYVVKDGQVIIVDEFTGRLMFGRRYSEGLHQAIEAKERVKIQRESVTLATITFQNYFRLYQKLAGMTGTALTEAEEFYKIYKLEVVVIPTNKPMIRTEHADQIYKDEKSKFGAVAREIKQLHDQGRPVLIGTTSIEKSERLSDLLNRNGIPHQVLNAKHHEKEAAIIAEAGRLGAVTVATNMAGRGVDIILGGKPEGRDETEWQEEHKKVVELGGLHIIGTEHHEARRIDNQLRGRAGRQGDAGSSRFYASLEDEIVHRFGGDRVRGLMQWAGMGEDTPIEHPIVNKAMTNAQVQTEGHNFNIRKHLVEYDDVINKHREVVYAERRKILSGADLKANILSMVQDEIESLVARHLSNANAELEEDQANVSGLLEDVSAILPLPPHFRSDGLSELSEKQIVEKLSDYAVELYHQREQEIGADNMRIAERLVMLRVIDRLWMEHLTRMEELRQGVGLRAIGQEQPLIVYKREGQALFDALLASIQHDVAHTIYRVGITREAPQQKKEAVPVGKKVGRNDPCPCGSGKKYKHCCGK
jgi:preprotein translocase subunit SecA